MDSLTTSKTGVLSSADGEISITLEHGSIILSPGDIIPIESTLAFEEQFSFVITFDDGTVFSHAGSVAPIEPTNQSEPVNSLTGLEEITQIQALIEAGEDPTIDLPETAAGETTGNQGGTSFSPVERTGNETLATAGFETSTVTRQASVEFSQRFIISDDDVPTVVENDNNLIAEGEVATGNILDNDSDVDSLLSVINFAINGETYLAGSTVEFESGVITINEDGSYQFTPHENWNGVVPVITYTTNTGLTATLSIEVTPIDDPSTLVNDSNIIAEDEVANGNVLTNDSDIDNSLSVISFE
ncbi:retention module-containing protein, partial [Shewanella sp. XMDDZSB0408]